MQTRTSLTATAVGISLGLCSVTSANAQEERSSAAVSAPLQEIIVTGTRIRRIDTETSTPVQILNRDDIEQTGRQSLAEVLRTAISADNQGSIPTAFSAGFASGASGVSLRGLGVNSTLVLLNGKRLASYGLADDGIRTFVDLNSIPLAAVQRVDVVKDGGSAIYGSDAIAGVVNIILRDTYEGVEIGGDTGLTDGGDGDMVKLFAIAGTGNERVNGYVAVEGSREKAINGADAESFLRTNDLRRKGFFDNRNGAPDAGRGFFPPPINAPLFSAVTPFGTIQRPGGAANERINLLPCPEISEATGVCVFDTIGFTEIQPRVERANVVARGTVRFTDDLKASLDLSYFNSKTESVGTPGSINDNGVFNPADPRTPIRHRSFLPANHPDNPVGVRSLLSLLTTQLGGRNGEQDNDVYRGVLNFDGLIGGEGDWNWNATAGYIRSELKDINTGFVRHGVLQDALDSGAFRIDGTLNSPELLAAISPALVRKPTSSVSLADATVSGSIFELNGQDVGLAVGVEYRRERTDTPPVPGTDTGEIVGLGFSAFSADRDVYSGYVEVNVPVLQTVELNAAYRYDEYSDVGSSRTPKIGLKYKPIPQLLLRGSFQEGFRAPGPAENGNSSSFGFTNIGILTIGNPDLKPEEADSYAAGIVFEPFSGTNISIDYYNIRRKNEILATDQNTVIGDLSFDGVPDSVVPGAIPNSQVFYNQDGQLSLISAPFINASRTNTDGFDVDVRQRIGIGRFGTLTANLIFSHINSFERELPDGSKFEFVGTHGPFVLSSAGGTPTDRARLRLRWDLQPVSVTASFNYVSSLDAIDHKGETLSPDGIGFNTSTGEGLYIVNDPSKVCGVYDPDGTTRNGCEVASFTTMDLYTTYKPTDNLEFSGSITNVFDRLPPFDPYTYGGVNYNPSFHQSGAVGRFITVGLKYTF